jgi:glucose/arabinose dehydrogenase
MTTLLTRFLVTAGVLGVVWAQPAKVQLPPPFHSPSVNNRPTVISRPAGAQLQLPQGFSIDEYASGFKMPRFMALGPSREVLLTDAVPKTGAVYVLRDKNSDGKADEQKAILENLHRPYGLAFWKDYLYVGEVDAVRRYRYDTKAMTAGAPEMVLDLSCCATGHWTRSLLFDAKGEKLYVGVGSQSNVSPGEPELRAAIVRVNPDGSGREIFASGTRNPIGLAWFPGSATLWAAVQERDLIGDDLVPDYFIAVKQGGFYGWPFAYIGPNEDPRNKGQRPDLVAKTIAPDVILGSHVAVLDARFYTGRSFPARYRGGAFLAFHGSWNRAQRVGYSVVFVPFEKNGKPAGPVEDFLTGFMLAPEKKEVWGRPVGLLELPDGSLLVSDDGGNKLWRISYRGK